MKLKDVKNSDGLLKLLSGEPSEEVILVEGTLDYEINKYKLKTCRINDLDCAIDLVNRIFIELDNDKNNENFKVVDMALNTVKEYCLNQLKEELK
jgi:hypothetical protein